MFCGQNPAKSDHYLSVVPNLPVFGLPFPTQLSVSGFSLPSTSCLCLQYHTLQKSYRMDFVWHRTTVVLGQSLSVGPFLKTNVGERISRQIRISLIKKARIFHGEASSFKSYMTWQPKEPFSCMLVNSAGSTRVVRACASWISEPLDGFVLCAKWGTTA